MKDNNWDEKKQKKAKVIVDYMMDHLDKDDKLFSVFLCLRLVVQPTHVLEELRDRINANLITQQDIKEAKPATCRRVKRGATIAQSFSMGTVARTRMNRRSVRLSEEGTSENDNNNSRYSDHIKVVDAFDEILSELETVRVSMPKSETTTTSPTSTRIRPSSIKQRPYSTFVAKSNFDEEEERVRDSGYMSQHNSQSSVASSASASATDDEIFAESSIDVDQMIFSLIDYWSLHFTGDLQYHDTLHLVMEILEKLRQRNKISLEQSASILLRVNRHLALTCNLSKPIRCKFTKRALKTKPFVVHYPAVKIAHRLTHIEMNLLQSTSVEHFIAKRSRNALDAWADWFNLLSHLTASQVCLASNTTKAAKVIDHLIQVAMECCASGNWNSAMAIALGLNLTPVARLTKTWSKVKSEKLFVLKQISDPAKNFKNYRLRMKNTCNVPFVSLLVKDACFQAQECKTNFEQNFVYDFDRFRGIKNAEENSLKLAFQSFENLAEPLINLQQSKKMPISNLDQNDELLALVQTPVLDEDLLYMASFKLESASNAYDKNTYKQLKAKIVS